MYPRTHKAKIFKPYARGDKRYLKHLLVQNTNIQYPDGSWETGRLADRRYFRIYKHKGQPYTLYLGPYKTSHGGLRVKSTDRSAGAIRKSRTKTIGIKQRKITTDDALKNYKQIESGPHSGKYKDKRTGMILTETQLRISLAGRK